MKTYTHEAIVTVPPHVAFPIDMLRYDCCCPVNESDSAIITRTMDGEQSPVGVRVTKTCTTLHWEVAYTVVRWQSFGVRIREAE